MYRQLRFSWLVLKLAVNNKHAKTDHQKPCPFVQPLTPEIGNLRQLANRCAGCSTQELRQRLRGVNPISAARPELLRERSRIVA
jgi:hypothetical protein